MRILVTGAGGFIGSNLACALAERGHFVIAVWRHSRRRLTDRPGIEHVQAELRHAENLPVAVDAIVHAAGVYGSDREAADDVAATGSILKYAERTPAKPFVYLSSIDAYGRVSVPRIDEATSSDAPNSYGRSKLENEGLVRAGQGPSISLRLPGIVGRDHNRPWIARLAAEMAEKGSATVYNPDSPFNNSLHVDDLSTFVVRLFDNGWQGHHVFPLAAAAPIPIRDIVARLKQIRFPGAQMQVAPGQRHSYTISIEAAQGKFGFAPMNMIQQIDRFAGEL